MRLRSHSISLKTSAPLRKCLILLFDCVHLILFSQWNPNVYRLSHIYAHENNINSLSQTQRQNAANLYYVINLTCASSVCVNVWILQSQFNCKNNWIDMDIAVVHRHECLVCRRLLLFHLNFFPHFYINGNITESKTNSSTSEFVSWYLTTELSLQSGSISHTWQQLSIIYP